jgi:hypothetical protein
VSASVADGAAHTGVSRWTAGEGSFNLQNRSIVLEDLRLQGAKEITLVSGKLNFGREADLTIETAAARKSRNPKTLKPAPDRVLKISGPLDRPQVSVEKAAVRQPAD